VGTTDGRFDTSGLPLATPPRRAPQDFRLAFDRRFMNTVVTRMDDNEAIFKRILDDDDFRVLLEAHYAKKVYERLRTQ
jgi:hypothetical protein